MKLIKMDLSDDYEYFNVLGIVFEEDDNAILEDFIKVHDYGGMPSRYSQNDRVILATYQNSKDGVFNSSFTEWYESIPAFMAGYETVDTVSRNEFWGNSLVLAEVADTFLNYKIQDSTSIDNMYEDFKADYFDRITENKKPTYKGNKAIVEKGIFINPYQVIKGLPAIPEQFRPQVHVADYRPQVRNDWKIGNRWTCGNWFIVPAECTEEWYRKVGFSHNYKGPRFLEWVPKKYQRKVQDYIEILLENLQGVEL